MIVQSVQLVLLLLVGVSVQKEHTKVICETVMCKILLMHKAATRSDEVTKHRLFPIGEHVQNLGYPFESHKIQTEDGYILTYHRIPHGRSKSSTVTGPPILLQHGIMSASPVWVTEANNLGFLLADAGYDVWLANSRGNIYSRGHIKYDYRINKKFFDFSWHEKGLYDLSDSIDYILKQTQRSELVFIGHSMGCTSYLVMGSMRPGSMSKIKASFLLAPIAFPKHVKGPIISFMTNFIALMTLASQSIQELELVPDPIHILNGICREEEFQHLCRDVFFYLQGYDEKNVDTETIATASQYIPAGFSYKELEHCQQISQKHSSFNQFDYGMVKNMEKYNSLKPPEYHLHNAKAPTYIYYSKKDWIASPEDVEYLAGRLPNVKALVRVASKHFNHIDFLWATDVWTLVYKDIFDKLKTLYQEPDNPS